jgi:hypothetical protein
METDTRRVLVERLSIAFGGASDVTPESDQPLHVLLPQLDLPEPWTPSPARALTVWRCWPAERPQFLLERAVVGESGEPPRNPNASYVLGESWISFSFAFPWAGDDPVRAVQLWLTRFVAEPV